MVSMMAEPVTLDCTPADLMDIITFPSGGLVMLPSRAMDEVFPNVYIGEEYSARDEDTLKKFGITHILNAAKGKDAYHVNTNALTYKKAGIEFLGIEATDQMNFKLNQYFEKTSDFIASALNSGGKVLVHCRQGASRSAAIVLAYLIAREGMSVRDAVRNVRQSREIVPNEGFLQQLCDLDKTIRTRNSSSKKL